MEYADSLFRIRVPHWKNLMTRSKFLYQVLADAAPAVGCRGAVHDDRGAQE